MTYDHARRLGPGALNFFIAGRPSTKYHRDARNSLVGRKRDTANLHSEVDEHWSSPSPQTHRPRIPSKTIRQPYRTPNTKHQRWRKKIRDLLSQRHRRTTDISWLKLQVNFNKVRSDVRPTTPLNCGPVPRGPLWVSLGRDGMGKDSTREERT